MVENLKRNEEREQDPLILNITRQGEVSIAVCFKANPEEVKRVLNVDYAYSISSVYEFEVIEEQILKLGKIIERRPCFIKVDGKPVNVLIFRVLI